MNNIATTLPLHPKEAAQILLTSLPSRRMRDIIEKRFGLKGRAKLTLDAIGKEYRITRERVRQIEADALRHLREEEHMRTLAPFFEAVLVHLKRHGGVATESDFFSLLGESRYHRHCAFLLEMAPAFTRLPEDRYFHARWTVSKERAALVEGMLRNVVAELEKKNPATRGELETIAAAEAKKVLGEIPADNILASYLVTLRAIGKNPYGEYGLSSSAFIMPRGIKDKAYMVLAKSGAPLHFREVARSIDAVKWSKKKAHPQTVHNELIKDKRFVLVGRGLYALKEWGYEPGAVREVLVSVLKQAGQPLPKEEVVRLVCEKRMVKAPTVILNLQNRSLFKRTEEGKYTLV